MNHLHTLNKGLERKIIELQLRLLDGERERETAQEKWNIEKHNYENVSTHSEKKHSRMFCIKLQLIKLLVCS